MGMKCDIPIGSMRPVSSGMGPLPGDKWNPCPYKRRCTGFNFVKSTFRCDYTSHVNCPTYNGLGPPGKQKT